MSKHYPLIIAMCGVFGRVGKGGLMAYFATGLFLALFLVGPTYFHWDDPGGRVSLALMTAFLLGAVAGYKAKG